MYKYIILILCLMFALFSGCSKSENIKELATIHPEDQLSKVNTSNIFKEDNFYLTSSITINDIVAYESGETKTPRKTDIVNIKVYKVSDYQNGSIYKLVIPPIDDHDGYLNKGRLNIYFYVTADKIYRLWSYIYNDEKLIEFYDDDNLLLKCLDTEEKIMKNSYLIFQPKPMPDVKKEDEIGMHNFLDIKDNQIISRMWITKNNGDTDFYEEFTWDLNKGLVVYDSGYGAESEILYIKDIALLDTH